VRAASACAADGSGYRLSLLKDRWEQAQEGMGQVILVIGEAGLGKSRLVQTLPQRVRVYGSEAALAAVDESASASLDQDSVLIEWRCIVRLASPSAGDFISRSPRS
jgi:predicted ATPase